MAGGGLVYLGIAKALKLEELSMVWRLLRRRGARPAASAD